MQIYDPFMQGIGDLYSQYKIESKNQSKGRG